MYSFQPNQPAESKWHTTGGRWEWRPCLVLLYDEEREQFLIRWSSSNRKKYVSRLNLRFNDEDKHSFALRLQAAHLQRLATEARVVCYLRCCHGNRIGTVH